MAALYPTISSDPQTHELQQMESSLETISERIAHLAIALGVSLKNESEMASAMRQYVGPVLHQERRSTPERRESSRAGSSVERRVQHTRQELRGLLTLRYDVLKHCVEQVGVAATRKILSDVEDRMTRRGFKRGDDGIDIDRLFNVP